MQWPSGWMAALPHHFPIENNLRHRLQQAELGYLAASPAAMTAFAENYVGLPFEDDDA